MPTEITGKLLKCFRFAKFKFLIDGENVRNTSTFIQCSALEYSSECASVSYTYTS